MTPYLIVVGLAVICAALAGSRAVAGPDGTIMPRRRGPAIAALASGALLTVMAAMRYRVGTDYSTYEENYQLFYRSWTWADFAWDDEPGIRILTWLSVRLHDDPATMFALASIITVGLMMWTYARFSTFFALSVLFFVLVGSWHATFNGVRQLAAAAIVFAGHRFVVERKFLRFLAVVAVASLFHISAVVLILLYFVPRRRLSWMGIAVLIAGALLASFGYEAAGAIVEAVRERDLISGAYFVRDVSPLRIALGFVPYLCYVLFAQHREMSAASHFHANMALLFGVLLLAASGSAHLARFAIYAAPFVALAIPSIVKAAPPSMRPPLTYVLICTYSVFWYVEVSRSTALNPFRWLEW